MMETTEPFDRLPVREDATAPSAAGDAGLHVWLLGHPSLQRRPEMVRVALRVFFRAEADALHAGLQAGQEMRVPKGRADPGQLARMLRGQGFLVALRRDELVGGEVVG